MIKFRKPKQEDNFLLYVPIKKHKTWEVRDEKVFLIFHHDKLVERFMRWLVKKPTVSDLELDSLGSEIWLYIDGKISVLDIGKNLTEKYGAAFDPEFKRLIMFLRYLNRKGWISFEIGNQ